MRALTLSGTTRRNSSSAIVLSMPTSSACLPRRSRFSTVAEVRSKERKTSIAIELNLFWQIHNSSHSTTRGNLSCNHGQSICTPMCLPFLSLVLSFLRRWRGPRLPKLRRWGSVWTTLYSSRPERVPAIPCRLLFGRIWRHRCVARVTTYSSIPRFSPFRKSTSLPHEPKLLLPCAAVCAIPFANSPSPNSSFTHTTNSTTTCSPCTASNISRGLIQHPFSNITH